MIGGCGFMGLNDSICFVPLNERDRETVNLRTISPHSTKLKVMILFTCLMQLSGSSRITVLSSKGVLTHVVFSCMISHSWKSSPI